MLLGPIIFVEDDPDDQEIIRLALTELRTKHEIIFFANGKDAFEYLLNKNVNPFIIFSDINMFGINGLKLWDKILAEPTVKNKCFPFIFLTTSSNYGFIPEVYLKATQGYFIKPASLKLWKELFSTTINHWGKIKNDGKE